jgi:large subunit ribosomal protein L46
VCVAQGGIEAEEDITSAAQRELFEECGPNLDVWAVGSQPIGHLVYDFPKNFSRADAQGAQGAKVCHALCLWKDVSESEQKLLLQVFFQPFIVLRGQARPNEKEGIVDFAWLTKEEIEKRVDEQYWAAVRPMLGRR